MIDSLGRGGSGILSDSAVWRSFGMLILVLALLLAAVWFLRRMQKGSSVPSLELEVLGRLPIAGKQFLSVVKVGKDLWVLGVSDNSIQYIGDYHGELLEKEARAKASFGGFFDAQLKGLGRKLSDPRLKAPQAAA